MRQTDTYNNSIMERRPGERSGSGADSALRALLDDMRRRCIPSYPTHALADQGEFLFRVTSQHNIKR